MHQTKESPRDEATRIPWKIRLKILLLLFLFFFLLGVNDFGPKIGIGIDAHVGRNGHGLARHLFGRQFGNIHQSPRGGCCDVTNKPKSPSSPKQSVKVLQKKKTTGKSVRQKNETHPCALLPTQHNTQHYHLPTAKEPPLPTPKIPS